MSNDPLPTSPAAARPLLSVVEVSKSFGSTHTLRGVTLDLAPGEVHALVGENGAGKSTLIKIATGLYRPDSGDISVDGESVELRSAADAQALGIACIYQEPLVFPDLSVSENIFMSSGGAATLVHWRDMHRRAGEILRQLEVDIDPRSLASQLTVGAQQAVEIAKAMSRDVRVLIMDEPTAALSAHEVRRLFRQVRRLTEAGVAVLFVSHRLDEVFELSDRITVLRDGQHISTKPTADVTEVTLIRDMVGRELDDFFKRTAHEPGEVALSVEGLGRRGAFSDVSFEVRQGEVLGFAGLVGSGRTEVAESLFGVWPADTGTIRRGNQAVEIDNPRAAMDHGIAYVSEDRRRLGLTLPQSVTTNITLAGLRRFVSRWGLVDRDAERRAADSYRQRLGIRTPSLSTPVANLSGGNQQKVMLAKWLDVKPAVLVLDEPTRGIDVGAKADVHELIGELSAAGVAVILISSDLPEVLAMSDRVLVIREGRQMGIFHGTDLEQERIIERGRWCRMSNASQVAVITAPQRPAVRRSWLRPERVKGLSLVAVLVVTILLFNVVVDDYLSARFVSRLLIAVSITALLAAGESLVIITRNIDLSVGSTVGVSAYLTAELLADHQGLPAVAAIAFAVGIGAALGLVNGVLVAIARVPSIIVTLGTLSIFRSLLTRHAGGQTIATGSLPTWLVDLPRSTVFTIGSYEIRTMFAIALVIVVLLHLTLQFMRGGRHLYALGSNPDAARQAGLNDRRLKIAAFVACGALAGLAGFLYVGRFGTINVTAGSGLELAAIAAAVVGGVSTLGGSGTVMGAFLGAVLIAVLDQSLVRVEQISEFWRDAILGTLILLAVGLDVTVGRRLRASARTEALTEARALGTTEPGQGTGDG